MIVLPKRVKIGGLVYQIKAVDNLRNDADDKLYGQTSYEELEIRIKSSLNRNRKADTLIHEIIHTITDERNLEIEEEAVRDLAAGLHQAICDNPKVIQFITGLK